MHSPLTEGRLTANCQTGLEMFALVVNMEHEIRPKITQSDSASFDDMHACLCNRKGSAVSSPAALNAPSKRCLQSRHAVKMQAHLHQIRILLKI